MSMELAERILKKEIDYTDPKIKTAYALNLCTVSVSQIIDYKDSNILEQEYDAILNNLNLEKMPKDEALLSILKQLLDTITFFRIEEGEKRIIDQEYQHKMKNAIWKAVPNVGLIATGGNPYTTIVSLASQVGIGYMNYRKEKAENALAYEKNLWQLHKSAIEQFNGLRRELFDTAWRLADAYNFPDSYRLTEHQVKQYNDILMDPDPYRRYERLDTIKEAFIAYPPFWYFMGNTANDISSMGVPGEAEEFTELAKQYYEIFIRSFSDCNLLRENQIASSCALEYISLLDETQDRIKIEELLRIALEMSGNANDILQMCAFAYLKINDTANAEKLLGVLVNENYNAIVNAQLLSGLYAHEQLTVGIDNTPKYLRLIRRVDEEYLYPLPLLQDKTTADIEKVGASFIDNQRKILLKKFGIVINRFQEKYRVLFNRCIPVPEGKDYTDSYYNESTASFENRKIDGQALKKKHGVDDYCDELISCDYPYNYLMVLNKLYDEACDLNCTQGKEEVLLAKLSDAVIENRETLLSIRRKAEDRGKFSVETYYQLIGIKFSTFTDAFFSSLTSMASDYLDTKGSIVSMNDADSNLRDFCLKQGFPSPEELYETAYDVQEDITPKMYLGIELIDDGETTNLVDERRSTIAQKIKAQYDKVILNRDDAEMMFEGSEGFDRYFIMLEAPNKRNIRRKTIAILDDKGDSDNDLLFTIDGIMQIRKGKLKEVVAYDDVTVNLLKQGKELVIHSKYANEALNMDKLISLIESLSTKGTLGQKEAIKPLDMLQNLIKKKP